MKFEKGSGKRDIERRGNIKVNCKEGQMQGGTVVVLVMVIATITIIMITMTVTRMMSMLMMMITMLILVLMVMMTMFTSDALARRHSSAVLCGAAVAGACGGMGPPAQSQQIL